MLKVMLLLEDMVSIQNSITLTFFLTSPAVNLIVFNQEILHIRKSQSINKTDIFASSRLNRQEWNGFRKTDVYIIILLRWRRRNQLRKTLSCRPVNPV